MRKVAIVGVGQTPVNEHWGIGLKELAAQAIFGAMDDAGISKTDGLFVGNMLSGILAGQENIGALIAECAGMEGTEAVKVEGACGSAALAFRQAVLAVASGAMETAVAVGVEKLTELSGRATTYGLATASDGDYEAAMGLSFVAINALLMRRYMHQYKFEKHDFALFAINAHQNAVHNPNAMFRHPITLEQYANAKIIADPISLLDSSPVGDGAAAVVVTSFDNLKKIPGKPVSIRACEVATDTIAVDNRKDPLWLKGVEKSLVKAFNTGRVSHKDIDFFEAHDAFSIMTALSLEASGFAEKGRALTILPEDIAIRGKLPLSTMGGLKGRGHPVGSTGLYQIVETCLQLRGEVPEQLQVPDAAIGLAQNIGGSGANVVTTVLERMS